VVAVALLSLLLFREPVYWTTVAGIVLVMAGVVLIAMRTA
jgi:small multidrug resistance pump